MDYRRGVCRISEVAAQKGKTMTTRVKAKFTNGHIVPLEPLDIEEGAELSVAIDLVPHDARPEESELHAVRFDDDPKRLKSILDEMDVEDYLRNRDR